MLKQNSISIIAAIAIVGATSFANADNSGNNPLHPSYYQSMYAAPTQTMDSNAAPYVDTRNPLSPSFGRVTTGDWITTGDTTYAPYTDSHNPLSPRFQR
jgi:hypothetical protein